MQQSTEPGWHELSGATDESINFFLNLRQGSASLFQDCSLHRGDEGLLMAQSAAALTQ
jgi:hypothetical protein